MENLNSPSLLLHMYQAKIPDIEKCLDVVATLQAKKGTGEVRSGHFMYFYISCYMSTVPCIE